MPASQTNDSGKQFDADGAILNSLAGLKVDLDVQSSVKLDQCEWFLPITIAVNLSFNFSRCRSFVCSEWRSGCGEFFVYFIRSVLNLHREGR